MIFISAAFSVLTLQQSNTGLASLYQLFLCLAVFCRGSMQEKAQFCFQMYDADDSGELEPKELTQFIDNIIGALFLVGEVAVRPQAATIEHLAAWCFKVTFRAFVTFCARNIPRRFLATA